MLGIPADLWVNLETRYQLARARQREGEALGAQVGSLKEFPVREMECRGWIPESRTDEERVRQLLRFFGVTSLAAWESTVIGFRPTPGARVAFGALAAWMRKSELDGHQIVTSPYSAARFRQTLAGLRDLTTKAVPTAVPRIQELCAQAGVAVTFVPELPKSGACGYARWLTREKALIALSLRYKTDDHLWFSFFHEAGHILKHRIRSVFIEGLDRAENPEAEQEADRFATDTLIPPNIWSDFAVGPQPTPLTITAFAKRAGVAPGILVRRLQQEGRIPSGRWNSLKVKADTKSPGSLGSFSRKRTSTQRSG